VTTGKLASRAYYCGVEASHTTLRPEPRTQLVTPVKESRRPYVFASCVSDGAWYTVESGAVLSSMSTLRLYLRRRVAPSEVQ
jgi:hypothetical protein